VSAELPAINASRFIERWKAGDTAAILEASIRWQHEHGLILRWLDLQRAGFLPTLYASEGRYTADGHHIGPGSMEILVLEAERREEEKDRLEAQKARLRARARRKQGEDQLIVLKREAHA